MPELTSQLDLGRLGLAPGEGRRLDTGVPLQPLRFGGQRYDATATVAARLDVSRTTGGYSLRLRAQVALEGPCMRCLEGADRAVSIDVREVDQPGGGEELSSPYLDGEELDLAAWTRDAVALALPAQIVCRDDCRGLCAVCGENLNAADADHAHAREPDPRWAALRELRIE